MKIEEVRPRLWRWTAYHREWKEEVGCVAVAGPELVLIDPLLPDDEPERVWRVLDRHVERHGPPSILVTVYYHARSAQAIADRYDGTRVWAQRRGKAPIGRRVAITDVYAPGDPLPAGVEAFPTARSNEVVFWLPEHRALVPGDVLLGSDGGGVRLCPASWLPGRIGRRELADSLRPLLALPVELVLVSHGDPVLERGRDALARAIDDAE